MKAADIPGISCMSIPEKILLVEDLWEDIQASEVDVPIPLAHKNELDRRFQKYKTNPGILLTLDQLQEKITARK
ncbi:MAG TPA: addiction module protein [Candidatus Deferrimicrobium sp.]|nr:addiction module protein [Candidatus Deferrimicrobium sp.]